MYIGVKTFCRGKSGTDVMIFKNILAKIFGHNIGVFAQTTAVF
jgi:hypothetical protein